MFLDVDGNRHLAVTLDEDPAADDPGQRRDVEHHAGGQQHAAGRLARAVGELEHEAVVVALAEGAFIWWKLPWGALLPATSGTVTSEPQIFSVLNADGTVPTTLVVAPTVNTTTGFPARRSLAMAAVRARPSAKSSR